MHRQDPALAPGVTLEGRYEILAKLGEGGFGVVHKARQRTTGQLCALKLMRNPEQGAASRADTRAARFLREARLSAQLHHPNLVQILDSGQTPDGSLYTVFAFAPGDSLAHVLAKEGALAPKEAQHLMLEVLDALACAHAQGVVHRDIKPSNIMVVPTGARRNALVLDFGIGAVLGGLPGEGPPRLTGSDDTLGTPGYGAPEQCRGLEPSPRADIFSWGLVFLECLTGRPVYSGRTAAEIFYHLLRPDPVPIPPALERHPLGAILRKATEKDVDARDVTACALLDALDACDLRGLSREAILGQVEAEPPTKAVTAAAPAAMPPPATVSREAPRAMERAAVAPRSRSAIPPAAAMLLVAVAAAYGLLAASSPPVAQAPTASAAREAEPARTLDSAAPARNPASSSASAAPAALPPAPVRVPSSPKPAPRPPPRSAASSAPASSATATPAWRTSPL